MAIADFIKEKFLNKELCVYLDQTAETLSYEQTDANNKEYFRGVILDVEDNTAHSTFNRVMTMLIPGIGNIYINTSNIVSFWEPSFDYYRAISASITRNPMGRRRYNPNG